MGSRGGGDTASPARTHTSPSRTSRAANRKHMLATGGFASAALLTVSPSCPAERLRRTVAFPRSTSSSVLSTMFPVMSFRYTAFMNSSRPSCSSLNPGSASSM